MAYGYRKNYRPQPAKQTFEVGQVVKIGFVDGLQVFDKVRTPRDGRPDFYVLFREPTKVWYAFQPHLGLTRCASYDEACSAY
jgi:hypothetical protein